MKHTQTFKNFESSLNEGFNFKGEIMSLAAEKATTASFSWMPPTTPVTVKSVDMDMPDEYNGYADIVMSNGDKIVYDLKETSKPGPGQTVPPFYTFSLKVNGKELTKNLDDVLEGGNSMTGDILNYYVKNYLTKN